MKVGLTLQQKKIKSLFFNKTNKKAMYNKRTFNTFIKITMSFIIATIITII